jgi:ankyrin repeat protein
VGNFLRIGYSPDTANAQGVPIVCVATRNGHKKIVELLLERGADVNVLSQDRGNSPLMEAAVRGDDLSVRRFLEAGANPNLVSKSGQTALMLAIGEGHKEIVRVLIEYRADLAIKDSLGMTARKYAEIFRHEEIVAQLEAYERLSAST